MKKFVVILFVIVLLAGLVLAVSAEPGGGGGGGGSYHVARVYCKHNTATNQTMALSHRPIRGTSTIRGNPYGCPSPVPNSISISNT